MSDEERFIQWLLAVGGDPEAPGADPRWRQRLHQDPAWRQLAWDVRRWDCQLRDQLLRGEVPETASPELKQRLLRLLARRAAEAASPVPAGEALAGPAADTAPPGAAGGSSRGGGNRRRMWRVSALAAAVLAVWLLWWLWPPESVRLARNAWQVLQSPALDQPERWYIRRLPSPEDEVPPVLRVSRRVRWCPVRVGRVAGVVHHLMNHETQSVQAWLFVLQDVRDSLPSLPPKRPQWQGEQAVAGCWSDARRGRTYVLVVPGVPRQYRFWIATGPLASASPVPLPGGGK